MKKLLFFLLALVLTVAISVPVFAECVPGTCYTGDLGPFRYNYVEYVFNGTDWNIIWMGCC